MTDFPTMVYRVPGLHRGPDGHTFDYCGIGDANALKVALADGWRETLTEAIGSVSAKVAVTEMQEAKEAASDVSPIARDELEQTAKALGVSFNARTKDEVLIQRIAEAS